jgi:hypothetical protein
MIVNDLRVRRENTDRNVNDAAYTDEVMANFNLNDEVMS